MVLLNIPQTPPPKYTLSPPGLEINRSPPVVTDVPPKPHRWTTAVASADFAVATGGPPMEVLTVPPVAHRRFYRWSP